MIIKVEVTCKKCKRDIRGLITLNKSNHIIDSDGFMIFEDEIICDTCLNDLPDN